MPLFIPAIIGVAGSIGGAAIASSGANKAANTQASAAERAAQLNKEASDASLAENKRQFEINQANQAPWLKAGTGAINTLSGLMGTPGEGLLTPWTEKFQAPTGLTMQNDPGFQQRLALGTQALERSAAAKGGLLSGGTAKALGNYAQDYASNEYGNVYNRAYNEYANRYNQFQNNQANEYNRLAGMSGMGQTTANQLGLAGQNFANNTSSILLGSARDQGNDMQNAAAARASGYLNNGNVWGNAFSTSAGTIGNAVSDWLLKKRPVNQSSVPYQVGGYNPITGTYPS